MAAREKAMKGNEDLLASATEVKSDRDRLQRLADNRNNKIVELTAEINSLSAKLKQAVEVIAHIVKAARLLKYGRAEDGWGEYKIENLSPKQDALLEALAHFGARVADKNNYTDHANRMRKNINLDEGIVSEMKILNPELFPAEKQKSRSSHDRGGR